MRIQIKSLGEVLYTSKPMHIDQCNMVLKLMLKHKKLLPKTYNRHKKNREYCFNVDKKISRLLKDDLFFSSYSGKIYNIRIVGKVSE